MHHSVMYTERCSETRMRQAVVDKSAWFEILSTSAPSSILSQLDGFHFDDRCSGVLRRMTGWCVFVVSLSSAEE